jgi:hypothetical protein
MARIVDTGIAVTKRTATHVTLVLGVDMVFTATEVAEGRRGAAKYSVHLVIWDEDAFSDDRIVSSNRQIAPADMQTRVGIDFPAELELANLRRKEPDIESAIELYGQFTVQKNNQTIAPSAKSRTVSVALPHPPPATSNTGQHISVRTEGAGSSTVVIVNGTKFTPSRLAVVRFTARNLAQLTAVATVDSAGRFEARRSVPCAPGITFTVTAFEDADPNRTFANAVETSCP